jgi:hypothetical protein
MLIARGKVVMQCVEVEKLVNRLVDGELELANKRSVEVHLNKCRSCKRVFENTQAIGGILKRHLPPVAPSSRLDAIVMEAFYSKQKQRTTNAVQFWRHTIFGWLVIPRPVAFAFATVIFAALLGFAFQLGRISATDIQITMPTDNLADAQTQPYDKVPPLVAENPAVKIVEVPVVREKIVTRFVYLNKRSDTKNAVKTAANNPPSNEFSMNDSIAENGYLTQTSLKGFQPVSKIKTTVIKGGNTNEK